MINSPDKPEMFINIHSGPCERLAMHDWAKRMEALRRERGWSRRQLADRAGVELGHINRAGQGRIAQPRGTFMKDVARALDVSERFLLFGDQTPNAKVQEAAPLPSRGEMPHDLPVMGTAAGSNTGAIDLDAGTVDVIRRPPGILNAKGVYAVHVVGESMEPRYFAGETVVASEHMPVRVGDHVIIQCRVNNGDQDVTTVAFVKVVTARKGARFEFGQYNPETPFSPPGEIIAVHRLFTLYELLG